MRFLIDEQLPTALARWIVSQGHDAQHVFDVGLGGASDVTIWQHASMTNAIIITKDEDFAGLAKADRVASVVWLRSGNSPRRALIEQMESVFKDICAALASGEMIVEVGRDG